MEDSSYTGRSNPQLFSGLHIDDFNKIRIFEPDGERHTSELQDGCRDFSEKSTEFCALSGEILKLTERISSDVDQQKIKAIGCSNALHNMIKEKATKKHQLETLIREKKTQLERLHLQYASLVKMEAEQSDIVDKFLLHN